VGSPRGELPFLALSGTLEIGDPEYNRREEQACGSRAKMRRQDQRKRINSFSADGVSHGKELGQAFGFSRKPGSLQLCFSGDYDLR
jgi:hypothetical protein